MKNKISMVRVDNSTGEGQTFHLEREKQKTKIIKQAKVITEAVIMMIIWLRINLIETH